MKHKDKLVIFDLDGTLFDTSEANYRAYRDAAKKYGYRIERERFIEAFAGKNYKDFLPQFGISENAIMEEIHKEKKKIYSFYLSDAKVNGHLFYILQGIRNEYQTALATTASRKNTSELLNAFGVTEYFDWVIVQEDVRRLKPDPECYLIAMGAAQVKPKDTLIFEDSENGVEAAIRSGASVCQIKCF